MQRIIFDQSPWLIFIALLVSLTATWLLYGQQNNWSRRINQMLSLLRFLVIFLICILALGPVLRLISNETEKPGIAIVLDQSSSMWFADSVSAKKILPQLNELSSKLQASGFEPVIQDFFGKPANGSFQSPSSDINGAINQAELDFDGRNLSGVVVVSDGIYNSGVSPMYHPASVPVYVLGFGDTTQRRDLKIKALRYNRIAYLGNQFPVRAEVQILGDLQGSFEISARHKNHVIASQKSGILPGNGFIPFDFLLDAKEPGLQKIDFVVNPVTGEQNLENNRFSAFIEILDSRKKILIIAPAPHPDIKLMHSVVEKNGNYETQIFIPGVTSFEPSFLNKEKPDLIIFNQSPDQKNITTQLVRKWMNEKVPALFVIGEQTSLKNLPSIRFKRIPILCMMLRINVSSSIPDVPIRPSVRI